MNNMAHTLFTRLHVQGIDQPAENLFGCESILFETLKTGRSFSNCEQHVTIQNQDIHFFINCTPVLNPKGAVIGAVATIKDYKQAEELTSIINKSKSIITFENIIHQSANMKQLIETAKLVSRGTSTVLLRGESGTGKELFAKAIHAESARSHSPFLAINCGALPDTLLESELFGYEPGAFTGAVKTGKIGLFEEADTGTVLLDEIGEVSPQMQVRLLRVLQERSVRRVGGNKDIPVDVRIIAATNRNLEIMMEQGLFREDLYYRLNVIPLTIPPLRERKEDIQLIAHHLTRKICAKLGKHEKYLTRESGLLLQTLDYPGNIRQLENMLELAVNLEQTQEIHPGSFLDHQASQPSHLVQQGEAALSAIQIPIPVDGSWPPLKEIISKVEKEIIHQVMKTNPSSRKAGSVLGISNTAILKKIKKETTRK